jgi:hypothetical protein
VAGRFTIASSRLDADSQSSKPSSSFIRMCKVSKPILVAQLSPVRGFWINVGQRGQSHLIGGKQPSCLAGGPGKTPRSRTSRLRVADIQETKLSLIA